VPRDLDALPVFYGPAMVAQWCGVPRHVVSNWLRRHDDFPVPAGRVCGPLRVSFLWREEQREEWVTWAYSKDVTVLAPIPVPVRDDGSRAH
jgi:hypothetical protein